MVDLNDLLPECLAEKEKEGEAEEVGVEQALPPLFSVVFVYGFLIEAQEGGEDQGQGEQEDACEPFCQ